MIVINLVVLALAERPGWQYDFSKSLKGLAQFDKRPKAIVRSGNIRSCCELIHTNQYTESPSHFESGH